jgi:hypothetical protein
VFWEIEFWRATFTMLILELPPKSSLCSHRDCWHLPENEHLLSLSRIQSVEIPKYRKMLGLLFSGFLQHSPVIFDSLSSQISRVLLKLDLFFESDLLSRTIS